LLPVIVFAQTKIRMRLFASLLLLLPVLANAQIVWPVSVGGSTITPQNLPFYSPQHIVIQVGDTVRWTNQSGTHNVNGSLSIFPGNPEGFTSGNSQSGGWVYKRKFNMPGLYNYHCTSNGHAATQFGSITVLDPNTGLAEIGNEAPGLRVYPAPATNLLTVELGALRARSLRAVDLDGREVYSAGPAAGTLTLDVSILPSGSYFLLITTEAGSMLAKPFIKD